MNALRHLMVLSLAALAVVLSLAVLVRPLVPSPPPTTQTTTIVIPTATTHSGRLTSIGHDLQIEGTVQGDVTTITGDILIRGVVTGDVVSYRGQVVISERARVDGHVLVLSSTASQARDARVAGQIIGATRPFDESLPAQLIATDSLAGTPAYLVLAGVLLAFMLMLALPAVTLIQRRTLRSGQVLLALPGYALLLGLVSGGLLSGGGVLLVLLLALTLVGLPLALTFLTALFLPLLYGLIITAQALALRLSRQPVALLTLLLALLLLLPVLVVGWYAPAPALLLFYLLASGGLGALVLSRGGVLLPARR